MSSDFGKNIRCSIFGQSHSQGVGVVIDGLPAGEHIDFFRLKEFMNRRAPGELKAFGTERRETDEFEIISGFLAEETCGAPVCGIIPNRDCKSDDYEELKDVFRPGHADFTAELKYRGYQDKRGGGHFSGRLTAPLCLAGGIALQILERRNIYVGAHALKIGNLEDIPFDNLELIKDDLLDPGRYPFPVRNPGVGESMAKLMELTAKKGDSLGGVIECAAIGVPGGLGEPMFDGIENILAKNLFGIPAVKGVEFGEGFGAAALKGSQNNDEFYFDNKNIKTKTNHAGGILGGITDGMPLLFRVAVKPVPSIAKQQDSVNIKTGEAEAISVKGRHDGCIVPRAVPVVEAVAALTILDFMSGEKLL